MDPVAGLLYGGTEPDGFLFTLDPRTREMVSLGKPTRQEPITCLTVGNDGCVFGMAGGADDIGHLFRYDPARRSLEDLGIPVSTLTKRSGGARELSGSIDPGRGGSYFRLCSRRRGCMEKKLRYTTIDEYIAQFSGEEQKRLKAIRKLIARLAPEATEKISYQMPTFYLNGNLIHFAGFTHHIGLYPTPQGVEEFKNDLSKYKQGRGSVQFPLDEPLPLDLIERIVKFRVERSRLPPAPRPGPRGRRR